MKPKTLSPSTLALLLLGGVGGILGAIILTLIVARNGDIEMSAHGWAALAAGTVISVIIGGVLSAVLVWGRQNGFDEGANLRWETPDASERSTE